MSTNARFIVDQSEWVMFGITCFLDLLLMVIGWYSFRSMQAFRSVRNPLESQGLLPFPALPQMMLSICGYWWPKMPGCSTLVRRMTMIPSLVVAISFILTVIVYMSIGFLSIGMYASLLSAILALFCMIVARRAFARVGSLLYTHSPAFSSVSLSKQRRFVVCVSLLSLFLSIILAVFWMLAVSHHWVTFAFGLPAMIVFFLSITCTVVPATWVGLLFHRHASVLYDDMYALATGEEPLYLKNVSSCVAFYSDLLRTMETASEATSHLCMPSIALVFYLIIVVFASVVNHNSWYLSGALVIFAAALLLIALVPAARTASDMSRLRFLCSAIAMGTVRPGYNKLSKLDGIEEVWTLALSSLDGQPRFAHEASSNETSPLTQPSTAATTHMSEHTVHLTEEEVQHVHRMLTASKLGEHRGFTLFGSVEITFGLLVRSAWILGSVFVFLFQLQYSERQ